MLQSGDVGLSIGLTVLAGFAAVLGGVIACCVKVHTDSVMSAVFGLSAGVMLYVSLVEVISLGAEEIHSSPANVSEKMSKVYSTLSFFIAGIITWLIDWASSTYARKKRILATQTKLDTETAISFQTTGTHAAEETRQDTMRSGLFAAAAIFLHNFPEGIMSYLALMEDPSIGVAFVIAIGVHNIPEGVSVAAPIIRGGGSKKRAMFWACLSGIGEPLGAVLCWAVVGSGNEVDKIAVGLLFGATGGIMAYIAVYKLMTAAFALEPAFIYGGVGVAVGAAVMAGSILLAEPDK